MNLLTSYLLWIKLGAVAAVLAGVAAFHVHAVNSAHRAGIKQEAERRDTIDAKNAALANDALLAANGRVRILQAQLTAAEIDRQKLQQENDHEKAISSQRAADISAGRQRERVLVRTVTTASCNTAQAGPPGGAGSGFVDPGASVEVDLDPGVGGWLEGVRGRHNDAVQRLDACIKAYGEVKAAVDAMP